MWKKQETKIIIVQIIILKSLPDTKGLKTLDMTLKEYWDPEKYTVDDNGIATPKLKMKDLTNVAADAFGNNFEESTRLMQEVFYGTQS